jgi:hypothetical protein
MRTLQLHCPDDALSTLDTVLKRTKKARVFRRAQAVREVVKGTRLQMVSDTLAFTYSALSNPTATSIFDLRTATRYAPPAYPMDHQEAPYVTSLSDRR